MSGRTEIDLAFHVPDSALEILKIICSQNTEVHIDIDDAENKVIICADVVDFPEWADDWDSIEDYEDFIRKVE